MCDYILMGKKIYTERKQQNISQKDLAKFVGVAPSTISRYEKGTFDKPKLPVIESISNCLNVNPTWLLGKSEKKHADNDVPKENTVVYHRDGKTKELKFTKEKMDIVVKMIEAVKDDDVDL